MRGGWALIVDDDSALLQALSDALQLRMRGLRVETSDSAPAALEQIAANDYDVIVADIKMPGMDGLELLARIRELRPETPTILITGHGEHDLAVQALRGGAQDYVQKPIDREYFVGALSHAIERRRLSRKLAQQKQALEHQSYELERCLEERTHELRELYRREALARAELEQANAELEAARQRRDELVAMIAHDLSTPLTTLRGYAELLARPNASPALRDRATSLIVSEAGRMARLVEDLVGAPAAAAGFSIRVGTCDMVELVREQIEVVAARARQHRIVLDAPARLAVPCDRERLAQVVANLLGNALTYTRRGEIRVRLWREGQTAHISVHDQGPGIPLESLDTIFEPHVRLRPRRRAGGQPNGAGLGLSIARDIVEAHGGRIWAESQPGDGATFSVALPMSPRRHPPGRPRPSGSRSPRRPTGSRSRVG